MNIDTDQALLESLNVSQHIWNCFEKYINYGSEQNMNIYKPQTLINKIPPSKFIKVAQPLIYKFLMSDDCVSLEVKCKTLMMTADMSLGVWDMGVSDIRGAFRRPQHEQKAVEGMVSGFEKNIIFFVEEAQKICEPFQSIQSKVKFKP